MRILSQIALATAITATGFFQATPATQAADLLTVGSPAPQLNVEHWLHADDGKSKPVSKFEPGKVYVVEFWATWCAPCVASMPHLASLQKEYADKNVRIVSISDEDLETVQTFLDREVRDSGEEAEEATAKKEKQTYRELTSAYSLTTDPDQSSYEDYMEAAAQNGIPTAFIVGKDAKIEWIGHPMELDGPLSAVVEGSWDRKAFAEEMKARQEAEKAMQDIFALLQKQDYDAAVALIDKTDAVTDSMQLKMLKLQVLIVSDKIDAAAAHLESLYKKMADKTETVNMIAWSIYEMAEQGRIEQGNLVDASIAATETAAKSAKGEEKGSLLDTLAHLYFVKDNVDKAIALETEALSLSGDRDREFIEGFLKELKAAKSGDKPEAAPKQTDGDAK